MAMALLGPFDTFGLIRVWLPLTDFSQMMLHKICSTAFLTLFQLWHFGSFSLNFFPVLFYPLSPQFGMKTKVLSPIPLMYTTQTPKRKFLIFIYLFLLAKEWSHLPVHSVQAPWQPLGVTSRETKTSLLDWTQPLCFWTAQPSWGFHDLEWNPSCPVNLI